MTNYRGDIDGLRALAVLSVIAFHFGVAAISGGFAGVDIFFVISGYLISSIILKDLDVGKFSFAAFYARRIRRIFPALICVLFFVLLAGYFFVNAGTFKQIGLHTAAGAAFSANFAFWREAGYFDAAAEQKPLLHLWSLGVEEQFYLVWPTILYLIARLRLQYVPIILTLGLLSFGYNIYLSGTDPVAAFYLLFGRMWELTLGSILAWTGGFELDNEAPIRLRRASTAVRELLAIVGLTLVGASFVVINGADFHWPGWWALLPTVGTGCLIAAGAQTWISKRILAHPALVFVGLISYPLYLWHWPLLWLIRTRFLAEPPAGVKAIAFVAAFGLAWATFVFIEKPFRFGGGAKRKSRITLALLIGCSVVGLMGYATFATDGFIARFPQEVRGLEQYSFDEKANYRLGTCYATGEESNEDQVKELFENHKCLPAMPSEAISPLVFLWGDSYAAALYPGLKELAQERHFELVQLNMSGCPPILDFAIPSRPLCQQINRYVLDKVAALKPKVVIIAARWNAYYWTNNPDLVSSRIDATLAMLKKSGAAKTLVIGPQLAWYPTLPALLLSTFGTRPLADMPSRVTPRALVDIASTDRKIEKIATANSAQYYSPFKTLCNRDGCLTKVGDSQGEDLLVWDYGHLTIVGSRFIAKNLAPYLP